MAKWGDTYGELMGAFRLSELRSMFPRGGDAHLLLLPEGARPGGGWPFSSEGIWSEHGSWDDLSYLFDAMCSGDGWWAYETKSGYDELRETCLVHHFHLDDGRRRGRSSYRWFAFRDPVRFGNVWFNLGGTYRNERELRPLWTSSVWMARIKRLYPDVAVRYRIRGRSGLRSNGSSSRAVRDALKDEKDYHPVVGVGDDLYLCAGGKAQKLDLDRCDPDQWSVFLMAGATYATLMEPDGETIVERMRESAELADRLERLVGSGRPK